MPVLFSLHINDMMNCVRDCNICMFVDDTILYIAGNIDYMFKTLNLSVICDLKMDM